jgi:hypothetical protein
LAIGILQAAIQRRQQTEETLLLALARNGGTATLTAKSVIRIVLLIKKNQEIFKITCI